jgi:hypothetical protein
VQDAFSTPGATPNLGVELTRLDVLGYKPFALTPPVVTAPPNQAGVSGVSTAFNLGSFTESKPRGPWRVIVSWGDGSPNTVFFVANTGQLGTKFHKYANQGTLMPKVTITDFTSQSGSKSFTVTATHPVSPFEVASPVTTEAADPTVASVSDTNAIHGNAHFATPPSFEGAIASSQIYVGGTPATQSSRDTLITRAADTSQPADLLFLLPVLWS